MSKPAPGKLVRTLRDLAVRPGVVTEARLEGTDNPYLPTGWVLVAAVVLFLALTLARQPQRSSPSPALEQACADWVMDSPVGSALRAAASPEGGAPPLVAGASALTLRFICDPAPVTRAFNLAVPVAFVLLMPLSALLMWVAFRRSAPRFAQHWAYGLEAHATLFGLMIVLAVIGLLGSTLLNIAASLAGLWYLTWNLMAGVQRTCHVARRTALGRTTLVGVVYALALAVVSVGLVWVQLR